MEDYAIQLSLKGYDDAGREIMYNVRGKTAQDFDANLEHLKKKYHVEKLQGVRVNGTNGNGAAPICGIHKTPMAHRANSNGKGAFWSCPKKLDTGEWCPYKPPKGAP